MQRYKRRTFTGVVLEQEVFYAPDNVRNLRSYDPEPRGRSPEEREDYNSKQSLKRFVRNVNNNFSPDDYYTTHTLDDDHLVDTFDEAKKILSAYIRSLQRTFPKVRLIAVMGRGKRTNRIHFHFIISGATRKAISQKWVWGRIKNIEHLREHNYYNRIDHGADYTGLAIYLFDHWTPEQGKGKRWRQTMNLERPKPERPTPIKRAYSEKRPPAAPKGYKLVESRSTTYGYQYFKYIKSPEKPASKRRC